MDHRQWKQRLNGSGRRSKKKELRISSVKENTIAKQMYEGFGFVATGEFVNDETVLLKEWR